MHWLGWVVGVVVVEWPNHQDYRDLPLSCSAGGWATTLCSEYEHHMMEIDWNILLNSW